MSGLRAQQVRLSRPWAGVIAAQTLKPRIDWPDIRFGPVHLGTVVPAWRIEGVQAGRLRQARRLDPDKRDRLEWEEC